MGALVLLGMGLKKKRRFPVFFFVESPLPPFKGGEGLLLVVGGKVFPQWCGMQGLNDLTLF